MNAPRFAYPDTALRGPLATAAARLLSDREAQYPPLVTAGKLSSDDAERKLILARAIDAQWRWVVDPAAPPLPEHDERTGFFGAFEHELASELTSAATRARAIADRTPTDAIAAEIANLYEALAWWQGWSAARPGYSRITFDVGIERGRGTPLELDKAA